KPKCFVRCDINTVGAGERLIHQWGEMDQEIGCVACSIMDQTGEAIAEPQIPRRALAAPDGAKDKRNPELPHKTWRAHSRISDVMYVIELFAPMQFLGETRREPLPQEDVHMKRSPHLPTQWLWEIEILEAKVRIGGFPGYAFDSLARFRS